MRQLPANSEPVRRQLLAMLAAGTVTRSTDRASLDPDEWAQLQHMARQHRLEPLLHGAIRSGGRVTHIPGDVAKSWEAAFQTSAMRTLAVKATLVRVNAILVKAGIAYAALKGARLAWHAYAHPALRPMRDLDLLVSPARARDAYQALVDHGFTLSVSNMTPIAIALKGHKHLPGLLDPASGTYVELHLRLFEHLAPGNAGGLMDNADALLANLDWLDLEKQQIPFLPPTETLLHLIVHSAHEHHFDNGPQVLNDVAALLASSRIDWPRFWDMAREGGWQRGCQLLLVLTSQQLGPQPIDWCDLPPEIPRDILDKAALMMLQDFDLRQDLAVQVQLCATTDATGANAKSLLGRFLPPKHVIAANARISPERPWVWLHYPSWLVSRLLRTLRGAFSQGQKAEVARAVAIAGWLAIPPESSQPPSRRP